MKVSLGGGDAVTLASNEGAFGLAVDATSLYWTNRPNGSVLKMALDGGAITTLVSGQPNTEAAGIAVDATTVYWTNPGTLDSSGSLVDSSGAVMKLSSK